MKKFEGVFTALITPFNKGAIDYSSFKRLLRAQLDGGIQGLVVCGTTAESPTLTSDEKKAIFAFVKTEVSGQVPLIFGSGTNSTSETIQYTIEAGNMGAEAALVVVPYYNRPPQRGLVAHFTEVADRSKIPIILYNVPSRTVARLDYESIITLAKHENIIGIKEASGDLALARRLHEAAPGFLLLSGDDGTFIPFCGVGGRGTIAVGSQILPKQFVDWCKRARHGEPGPTAEFEKYRALIDELYVEANPMGIKKALQLMGIISSAELRLPMIELSDAHSENLRRRMTQVGLI
jgi:4-hydroxy-tetrahydrodipicolinate synthase